MTHSGFISMMMSAALGRGSWHSMKGGLYGWMSEGERADCGVSNIKLLPGPRQV